MLTSREIKAKLVLLGVKQADIARQLGISHVQVSEVLHGRRRSERVEQAIAAAIAMPAHEVFAPREQAAA